MFRLVLVFCFGFWGLVLRLVCGYFGLVLLVVCWISGLVIGLVVLLFGLLCCLGFVVCLFWRFVLGYWLFPFALKLWVGNVFGLLNWLGLLWMVFFGFAFCGFVSFGVWGYYFGGFLFCFVCSFVSLIGWVLC